MASENIRRVTNDQGAETTDTEAGASWSPDGNQIAFASNARGNFDIYVMTLLKKGHFAENLTRYHTTLNLYNPRFSGHIEFFQRSHVTNLEDGNLRQLTDDVGDDTLPLWSPDSMEIVFSSTRENDYGIYIMEVDGEDVEELYQREGVDAAFSWD